MSASGNKINYNLRASKSVERKMILLVAKEIFKNIENSNCRYVGFGSTYFADFKLFHKELSIDKMISFELEEKIIPRVNFNRPYKCIKVIPGKSTTLLPQIWNEDADWNNSTKDFIWMDYDGELEYDYFNDLENIMSNINAGSIYLISCNKQLKYNSVESFKEQFGDLVPIDIKNLDFSGEKDFLTIRKMLLNKINDVLNSRNYTLDLNERLIFRQLFFFTYKDNAPMISFGGVVDLLSNDFNLGDYDLNKFEFISIDDNRYYIDPPKLTVKEIYLLDSHLPNSHADFVNVDEIKFIPETDRNKYRKLYKYLPNYMDVVI